MAYALCSIRLRPGDPSGGAVDGPGLAISVAPLSLNGISDACYTLTVRNGAGDLVLSKTISSSQYGDGAGAATYVATCDATASVADNTVTLDVLGLYDQTVADCTAPPSSVAFQNPGASVQTVQCAENADTPVTFELTLMRPAQQGFFDVAVSFADIFCSAKFDCAAAGGGPIDLLFDASGERAATAIFAVACTDGVDTVNSDGDTTLHMDDLVIDCGGAPGTVIVDPSAGLGNVYGTPNAAGASILYQAQVTAGLEDLVDSSTGLSANKVYWTVALGVDGTALATAASGCTVSTRFTASRGLNDATWAPTGVYPAVALSVPLTLDGGVLACGGDNQHGLDALSEAGSDYLTTTYPGSNTTFDRCAHDSGAGALSFCTANQRTAACTGLPTLAEWNTASTITQTWDGSNWQPSLVGAQSAAASTTSCVFDCIDGYAWDGGVCISTGAGNTALLLHMDGVEGSSTFVDEYGHTVTAMGGAIVAAGSANFGSGGAQLGTGKFLQVAASPDFELGVQDFTIEGWLRPNSNSRGPVFGMRPSCLVVAGVAISQEVGPNGMPQFHVWMTDNGSTWVVSDVVIPTEMTLGQWHHLAIVRSGRDILAYVDGEETYLAIGLSTPIFTANYNLTIGRAGDALTGCETYHTYDGSIDEWRITMDGARYPALIVPEAPMTVGAQTVALLHMDGAVGSTTFTDELGHAVTSVNGTAVAAAAFAGTGSAAMSVAQIRFLRVAHSADLNFGGEDFTIEGWAYTNSNLNGGLYGKRLSTASNYTQAMLFQEQGTTDPNLNAMVGNATNNGWVFNILTGLTLNVGAWNHIAMVRDGNRVAVYVNGRRETMSLSLFGSVLSNADDVTIGATGLDSSPHPSYGGYDGNLDEWRITKGDALYIPTMTVPVGAFPNP